VTVLERLRDAVCESGSLSEFVARAEDLGVPRTVATYVWTRPDRSFDVDAGAVDRPETTAAVADPDGDAELVIGEVDDGDAWLSMDSEHAMSIRR
jgi:hypothetical protein